MKVKKDTKACYAEKFLAPGTPRNTPHIEIAAEAELRKRLGARAEPLLREIEAACPKSRTDKVICMSYELWALDNPPKASALPPITPAITTPTSPRQVYEIAKNTPAESKPAEEAKAGTKPAAKE